MSLAGRPSLVAKKERRDQRREINARIRRLNRIGTAESTRVLPAEGEERCECAEPDFFRVAIDEETTIAWICRTCGKTKWKLGYPSPAARDAAAAALMEGARLWSELRSSA